jgi:hypothetical protein
MHCKGILIGILVCCNSSSVFTILFLAIDGSAVCKEQKMVTAILLAIAMLEYFNICKIIINHIKTTNHYYGPSLHFLVSFSIQHLSSPYHDIANTQIHLNRCLHLDRFYIRAAQSKYSTLLNFTLLPRFRSCDITMLQIKEV